jgi:type II secretory pathway component PulF
MSHALAALSDAGVPLIRSLGTAGRVSGSSLVMDALDQVSVRVQQGPNLGHLWQTQAGSRS